MRYEQVAPTLQALLEDCLGRLHSQHNATQWLRHIAHLKARVVVALLVAQRVALLYRTNYISDRDHKDSLYIIVSPAPSGVAHRAARDLVVRGHRSSHHDPSCSWGRRYSHVSSPAQP